MSLRTKGKALNDRVEKASSEWESLVNAVDAECRKHGYKDLADAQAQLGGGYAAERFVNEEIASAIKYDPNEGARIDAERKAALAERDAFAEEHLPDAVEVRGELLGRHADLVAALPESRREILVDQIAANAVLDGHDGIGALAAETCDTLAPSDPRWQRALDHALTIQPEPDPVSEWSGEMADSWLRHHHPEPSPGTPTVVVGADGKTSSGEPSVSQMLKDIERLDAEKAARNPKPADEYSKYFTD